MNKIEELKKVLPTIPNSVKSLRKESVKSLCGPCPKCGGDDRFYTRTDKDFFECRQCGAKGDVIDFYAWIEGTDTKGLIKKYLPSKKSSKPAIKNTYLTNSFEHYNLGYPAEKYAYTDAEGKAIYYNCRFKLSDGGKTFRQCDASGLKWSVKDIRPKVPYNLLNVIKSKEVFCVEGEKDVHSLAKLNLVGTCNVAGAGNWTDDLNEYFRGKDVFLIPDNDDPGRKHIEKVYQNLKDVAASIKAIELPGLPDKGDFSDWIDQYEDIDEAGERFAIMFDGAEPYIPEDQDLSETSKIEEDPEPSEWDSARELFPRTPFPWKVLPVEIAESLKQLARSHATSPLSLPGAALAIFASVLGATVNVSPKKNWLEYLIVWFADIRPSGSGKTPAARALCNVLYNAQKQADVERKCQVDEEMEKRPKDRREVARSRSYFITDPTLEGLRADVTGHGGSVCIMDELSSFISGQNQYKKKGNDREAWLAIHDGNPARIVRAKESMTIHGARISLFGGIQPRVWQTCFSGEKGLFLEDGTVYRFLPTFENDTFYELTAESWSDKNSDAWEQTLTFAMEWADQVILDEDWKTKSLCLSEDAQDYFFSWRNDLYAKKSELPDQLKGFLPKISSYALRLSGALYCMDRFAVGSVPGGILSKEDVGKGVKAVTFYLGHIVDAMQALCSKDRVIPIEITEQTKHLAITLKNLKSELDKGKLAVGRICERFNQGLPPEQQIKRAKVMGTFLRQCGLTIPTKKFRIRDKSGLSCLMWDQKLNNFLKKVCQHYQHSQQASVGGASQVLTKEIDCQHYQHSVSDINPYVDNVDENNRLSTTTKPCQSRYGDNVDNVDEFFKESKKFTMEL